jgi:hypothetical protein
MSCSVSLPFTLSSALQSCSLSISLVIIQLHNQKCLNLLILVLYLSFSWVNSYFMNQWLHLFLIVIFSWVNSYFMLQAIWLFNLETKNIYIILVLQ